MGSGEARSRKLGRMDEVFPGEIWLRQAEDPEWTDMMYSDLCLTGRFGVVVKV